MNKNTRSSEDEFEARLAYYQIEAKRDACRPDDYLLSSDNNGLTEEVPF